MVKFGYFGIFLAYMTSSVGWFLAAEDTLLKQLPVIARVLHHTVGVFFYSSLTFIPVNAASDLMSGYLVNYLTNHFDNWSEVFKQMTNEENESDETTEISILPNNFQDKYSSSK